MQMKKIINGKMYNTETALLVGTCWNGLSSSDFACETVCLYRKKTGEYFLAAAFGPRAAQGNGRGWDECIKPITGEYARTWSETNLTIDEYIAEFGEPEE